MSAPKRGRPRSEEARRRALEAGRALLEEGGIGAVTIEAVAERARVARPTLYRSWPNAQALAMAALMDGTRPAPQGVAGRPVSETLKQALAEIVAAFAAPAGRSAAALIAASDDSTELAKAFRHHVLLRARDRVLEILADAMARGEVRQGVDPELVADLVMAPVFFRLLVGHRPVTAAMGDALVDHVLAGIAP